MAHEVRAVVARAKQQPVTIETISVPDPGPGEALVKVKACGVCHTDLHYREGGINDDFPFLLGHEAAGIVEAVGDGCHERESRRHRRHRVAGSVRHLPFLREGPPVVLLQLGERHAEDDDRRHVELSPALGIGAFAEKTLVAATQCVPIDPSAKPEAAGLIGCGVMAGLGAAMYTGNVQRGDTVAVFGCGGVGDARDPGRGARRSAHDHRRRHRSAEARMGKGLRRDPHGQQPRGRRGRSGEGADRRQRRGRVHRGGRQPRGDEAGVLRPRPRGHARAGRRAEPDDDHRAADDRVLRSGRRAQAELVRRLPAEPRLPDADRRLPRRAGSTSTASSARRSRSTASRRPSTAWSAARCCARWWCSRRSASGGRAPWRRPRAPRRSSRCESPRLRAR